MAALTARQIPPGVLAGALVLLVISTEWKFRAREADLAVSGVLDWQILVELAVWAVVGLWVLWHLVVRDLRTHLGSPAGSPAGGPSAGAARAPRSRTGLRLLVAAGGLLLVSSLYAPATLAVVRAVQWVVLILWAALAWRQVAADEQRVAAVWTWLRRLTWAATAVAIAGSAVLPLSYADENRYQWFAMHPITTGNTLGLTLVMVVGTLLALPDGALQRRSRRWLRTVMTVTFVTLLLATRSRGALLATVVALLTLLLLTPSRRRRAVGVMLGGALAVLAISGTGVALVLEFVAREQTTAQLQELSGRGDIFSYAWTLIGERPLFGYGYLSGRTLFLEAIRWAPGESHNVFVEIALSAGLVGLAVFILLLGVVLWRLRKTIVGSTRGLSLVAREAVAVVVFAVVNGMVAESFISPGFEAAMLVWAVLVADAGRRSAAVRQTLRSSRALTPSHAGAGRGARTPRLAPFRPIRPARRARLR